MMSLPVNRKTYRNIKQSQLYKLLTNNTEMKKFKARELESAGKKLIQVIGVNGVNERISDTIKLIIKDKNCSDYTLLHCIALQNNLKATEFLLNNGADFTIKNHDGQTPLHIAIESHWSSQEINKSSHTSRSESFLPLIKYLLLVHIYELNVVNPTSNDGLSHFHIACAVNCVEVVKFYLEAEIPINQAVNQNASRFPGFTPLHFAAKFSSLESVELLLDHDPNIHYKDAKRISPLHILLQWYMQIIDKINLDKKGVSSKYLEESSTLASIITGLIDITADNFITNDIFSDEIGLTIIHVVSVLGNNTIVENIFNSNIMEYVSLDYVNNSIRENSPVWPGYTALHFAAHSNLITVRLLLQEGANILAKDVNEVTPLDLCLRRYTFQEILPIIFEDNNFKIMHFSDNSTRFLDMILAMETPKTFNLYLENLENKNLTIVDHTSNPSPWKGFTLLHIAVVFGKLNWDFDSIINVCLKNCEAVTAKAANGLTPIQLAFQLGRNGTARRFLNASSNVFSKQFVNSNFPSHFHIACCVHNIEVITKCLKNKAGLKKYEFNINDPVKKDFNFKNSLDEYQQINVGMTPLHIAVMTDSKELVKLLLQFGADPNIADMYGITPIHLLFFYKSGNSEHPYDHRGNIFWEADLKKEDLLLKSSKLKNCITEEGFSHLHVVCRFNKVKTVIKLLNQGENINAMIKCKFTENNSNIRSKIFSFLSGIDGYTSLQIASKYGSHESIKILLEHGAEIQVENNCGWYSLVCHSLLEKKTIECLIPALKSSQQLKKFLDETGLTVLHFACAVLNKHLVMYCLQKQADVNAKMHCNKACAWSEFTPMHIVLKMFDQSQDSEDILNMLLKYGADATIKNSEGLTPIHVLHQTFSKNLDGIRDIINTLLEHQNKYDINPTDANGLSHFHMACFTGNCNVIKQFLLNGVNVNQHINHFDEFMGGYTGLHITLSKMHEKASRLLLNFAADVRMEDNMGNTPLHIAVSGIIQKDIFRKIIRIGAYVNAENILGETPLQLFLNHNNNKYVYENIGILLMNGLQINIINNVTRKGLLSIITTRIEPPFYLLKVLKTVTEIIGVHCLDENGFNIIHNIVSTDQIGIKVEQLAFVIQEFLNKGCEIDRKDNQGRTPLHVATKFNNYTAVNTLLMLGADINLTDKKNKSPLSYCIELVKNDKNCAFNLSDSETICIILEHLKKMTFAKLHISNKNKEMYIELQKYCKAYNAIVQPYITEREVMKKQNVTEKIKLHNFLSEYEAVIEYPKLLVSEREKVDIYFRESQIICANFINLKGLLRLQHRKAQERVMLWKLAINSMISLGIRLTNYCLEIVYSYLTNDDLKALIRASHKTKRGCSAIK